MYCAGTPRARWASASLYRVVSSGVSVRSGCANKYARSHDSVNMSSSSAFIRGDGTCSAVNWSTADVNALLSCTALFHHGQQLRETKKPPDVRRTAEATRQGNLA